MKEISRVGKLGASEIAGLVKDYAGSLLSEGVIDQGVYQELVGMPAYLETRYSLARKLSFEQSTLKAFNEFIATDAMKRGSECEEMVKDDFLSTFPNLSVVASQVVKEVTLPDSMIPLRATIDYLLSDNSILECKTTAIDIYHRNVNKIPFSYRLQLQMQLMLHEQQLGRISLAAIETVSNGRGAKKSYKLLDSFNANFERDEQLINAIKQSIYWFDYELKNAQLLNKPDSDKTRADHHIDEFLAEQAGTKEIEPNPDLLSMLTDYNMLKEKADQLQRLKLQLNEVLAQQLSGASKLRVVGKDFVVTAEFTKPSYYTQECIQKKLEEAQSLEIGSPKSQPRLIWRFKE